MSSCTTDRQIIRQAEEAKAREDAIERAALIAAQRADLPPLPARCRGRERAGVNASDRVDVALVKYDRALGRANAKIIDCGLWFEQVRNVANGD